MQLPNKTSTLAPGRSGMATLEFAMALPILLLVIVGIVWLGYIVVGQAEVLVIARTNAWSHRFDDKAKNPLVFPTISGAAPNPLYSAPNDYATETATKAVHVSRAYDHFATPKATHTILAGAWDHRAMPFDKFPDPELLGKAGAGGIAGSAEQIISTFANLGSALESLGASLFKNALDQITGFANGPGGTSDTKSAQAAAQQQANKNADDSDQKNQQRLKELGGRVNDGKVESTDENGQLGLTIKEIDRLQGLVDGQKDAKADKDPAKEKVRVATLEENKRLLELEKGKRQRLESDIRDADAALNK